MVQRQTHTTHTCPQCSAALVRDNGVLRCDKHGTFFVYGPQLLVRTPRMSGKLTDTALPWENGQPKLQR